MKKLFSFILCIVMLCTMFSCLMGLTALAEVNAPVRSLVGKQVVGFNNADWTVDVADTIVDADGKLKAPASRGTVVAQTNAFYSLSDKWEVAFTLKFKDFNNFNGEYAAVILGTNEIRIANNSGENTYIIEVYNSTGLIATASLGEGDAAVNGDYTFAYNSGVLSGTFGGTAVQWTVGESTAEEVEVAFDAVKNTAVKVSVTGNWSSNRYINNFTLRGTVNGDNNYDGSVDSSDLLLAQQAMLGLSDDAENCDSTYDDKLTAGDILALTQHLLGRGWLEGYESDPVNIMCIGDSITEGVGTLSGWRYSFFEQMYAAGVKFNLVGSYTTTGDFRLPEGYRGYSAKGGWTTKKILENMSTYVENDFDVVAIMLGYNDRLQWSAETSIEYYCGILDAIYAKNPEAYVYVSTMSPDAQHLDNDCAEWYDYTINPLLPDMVAQYAEAGYTIKFVNNIPYGWTAADFPASDYIHPTEKGRAKIATAFCDVMKNDMLYLNNQAASFTYEPKMNVVTDLTVTDSAITIEEGYAKTVGATVTPSNAPVQNVLWSSDDEAVATVDFNGRITGVSVGTATITAKTLDNAIEKTVTVTVTEANDTASTELFSESFDTFDNWNVAEDTVFVVGDGVINAHYTQVTETITTVNEYTFTNGFEIEFDYKAYGNEGKVYGDGFYGAVGYAGYELRCADAGRQLILVGADGSVLGSYSTVATIYYVNCRLVYKDGTMTAYYNNEPVIVAQNITVDSTASAVTFVHNQRWRNVLADNIYLGSF